MNEIKVGSQEAWDKLPKSFDEYTIIIVETKSRITITSIPNNSSAELTGNSSAELTGNSSAKLWDNSSAVLWDNSSAELTGNSSAELWDNSSAVLWGNSSAELWDSSSAVLWGNSSAVLWDNSSAELWDNSSAVLWDNSSAKYCDEVLLRFLDIHPIGSRQDHLKTYITDKSIIMRVGCFYGTPDEFSQAVINKHSGNQHFTEYMAALDMIRSIEKQIRGRL